MPTKIFKTPNQEFIKAVQECFSAASTLRVLNIGVHGSFYPSLYKRIKELNLDISHWTGQAHLRGKNNRVPENKKSLDEILVENSTYGSNNSLKKRLIKEGILENKCKECGLINQWNNKPLTLHLDHINGTHNDNRRENLRLLCPNCHSQTPTYCAKKLKGLNLTNSCLICKVKIVSSRTYCQKCFDENQYKRIETA